jgi:hypothetical protein
VDQIRTPNTLLCWLAPCAAVLPLLRETERGCALHCRRAPHSQAPSVNQRQSPTNQTTLQQQRLPGCTHGSRQRLPIIPLEQPPPRLRLPLALGQQRLMSPGWASRAPAGLSRLRAGSQVAKRSTATRGARPGADRASSMPPSRACRPAHQRSSSPAAGGRAVQSGAPDAWLSYDWVRDAIMLHCTGGFPSRGRLAFVRRGRPGAPAAHFWLAGLHAVRDWIGLRRVAWQPTTKVTVRSVFVHSIQWNI